MCNQMHDDELGTGLAGDTALQTQALEDLGAAPVYQSWLCQLAMPYLGDDPIELGSGNGDYAAQWLAHGLERITLTEVDPSRRAMLDTRFAEDTRVTVGALDLASPARAAHSCLVSFNVLEHIRDDVTALTVAHSVVRAGGFVVHFVPAFPIAMSQFDRDIGHYRRYRRKRLVAMVQEAGLELVKVHHVNMPGFVAWFVMMRLLRRRPSPGPLLWVWDRIVIRAERRLERVVQPPFGQSLLLVARVPE
jgi:hypothetical protein